METNTNKKMFFLDFIDKTMINWGVSESISNIIIFVIVIVILSLLVWMFKTIGSKIVSTAIKPMIDRTESNWDDFLFKQNFYARIIQLVIIILISIISKPLFNGFGDAILRFVDTIISILIICTSLQLFNSVMGAVVDHYETKPQARQKSIRSLVQSVKIIAVIISVILIFSVILNKNPTDLLVALGASAAIISLVFKDTILGFVASLQVSAQDMARPGDWIEMPSRGADGVVTEINITNVKVRNWDNSVSMIPTYAMVSESFVNWRNMQESEGRRFKRSLLIDINSVAVVSEEQIERIRSCKLIRANISEKMFQFMSEGNTSCFITNLGLFRCYIEAYLSAHPKVVYNQLRVVRYLEYCESGITLQIYAFSVDKNLVDYEHIIADIFENLIIITSVFNIKIYQRSSSNSSNSIA